jgi:hypothetical protein
MKKILILSIIVTFLGSCNLFKGSKNKQEEVIPIAKIDDFNNYRENDNYSIVNAFIDGNILNLDVTYSGGCKTHNFELIGSNMVAKSLPPQRNVLLVHHANGDDCRELMGERIKFNIQNLAFDGKDVMLIINGYKNEILYQVR